MLVLNILNILWENNLFNTLNWELLYMMFYQSYFSYLGQKIYYIISLFILEVMKDDLNQKFDLIRSLEN